MATLMQESLTTAEITVTLTLLDPASVQRVDAFLHRFGQSASTLAESSFYRFLVASQAPLAPVGTCKCAGCRLVRGQDNPLLAVPMLTLEQQGILPLADAAARARAGRDDLQLALCTSCFYVGFPTRRQLEEADYL
jgi:hypothetical protein